MRQYVFNFFISCLFFSINVCAVLPNITNQSPSVGTSSGGTSVAITGSGFTGATAVSFGTIPATAFIVNSDTSITAVSPPHTPQVISVIIKTPSGKSITTENTYYTFHGGWQAYVTNLGSNNVSVINTTSLAVSTSVPVGVSQNAIGIIWSPVLLQYKVILLS